MSKSVYLESKPVTLPDTVFNLYQYIEIDLRNSPGIMMEDGCQEFLFFKQNDVQVEIYGHPPVKIPSAFSFGKMKRPYKFRYTGEINYFAVKLQPWAARHFFPSDDNNQILDLTTLYGSKIETLRASIFNSDSFEEMIKTVEDFFANIEIPNPDSYKLAMDICERISFSKGMISVRELMKDFSQSRRKINQSFLFQTKFSIKEFSILVKIREALKYMHENPDASLTDISHQFDYFDQSHFNRDIKRMTNATPGFLFSTENLFKEQLRKD